MPGKLVRNGDQQFRKFVKAKKNSLENPWNWEQGIMGPELAVCPRAKLIKKDSWVPAWV